MVSRTWRKLRDLVTVNAQLKLLAIGAAVVLQLVVYRDSVRDVEVSLPLQVIGVPAGQIYVGSLPDRVRLRVRGRRVALTDLEALRARPLTVDLSSYRDGERYVFEPRQLEQQSMLRGVEVVAAEPASLDVRLEAQETRAVPVEVLISGEPAVGYRASARTALVQPATVKVTGPVNRLRHLTAVRTVPIELAGRDKDVQINARLTGGDDRLRFEPEEVAVTVRVEEADLARVLVSQAVVVRNCPPDSRCTVDPPEINVRVEGLGPAVRAFMAAPPENLLVADLSQPLRSGDETVKLLVHLVRGLVLTPAVAVAKFTVLRQSDGPVAPQEP